MSERGDTGLTLMGLAHRLEALERENAQLRSEVSALRGSATHRDELVTLGGSETPRGGEVPASERFAGRVVSRRSLLGKAGAAALGAVAAGTLLNQREAQAVTGTFDHVEVR